MPNIHSVELIMRTNLIKKAKLKFAGIGRGRGEDTGSCVKKKLWQAPSKKYHNRGLFVTGEKEAQKLCLGQLVRGKESRSKRRNNSQAEAG